MQIVYGNNLLREVAEKQQSRKIKESSYLVEPHTMRCGKENVKVFARPKAPEPFSVIEAPSYKHGSDNPPGPALISEQLLK